MNILVVDDQEFIRLTLEEVLSAEGCRVTAAASGKAAFDLLEQSTFDCVITDLRMPAVDGLDVLRWVRDHQPEVDVILLSGHGDLQTAVEAMKAGAVDFLVKETPFDGSEAKTALVRLRNLHRLRKENRALRADVAAGHSVEILPGSSPAWRDVMLLIEKIAPSQSPVLIQGETGSGKEVVARELHRLSPRREAPFLAVNCGTLAGDLLASELFGHEKGAFTGAAAAKLGLIAAAGGGTLFLDEIAEMSGAMQVALLRVLDQHEYRPVGGTRIAHADVRFIAATNRDLQELVHAGRFRDDLLYRINTVPVTIPPLRKRPEDIPRLAEHFLRTLRGARSARSLATNAVEALQRYPWPGNVRELRNVIERVLLLAPSDESGEIGAAEIRQLLPPADHSHVRVTSAESLSEAERMHILRILDRYQGNKAQAARALQIDYKTLLAKLKRYEEDPI